jgi:hypothetical protein
MKYINVLIDFDNYFGIDIKKITPERIEFSLKELISLCETEFDEFNSIRFRLYGGWYCESSFTKQASTIQQILSSVNVFPKVSMTGIITGKIELATSLHIKPDFVWSYTHKETNGIKRIRINHDCADDICQQNRTTCPKFLLYKFTSSKDKKCHVSDCDNLQKNVFKGAEQKMVDTLLACDIISSVEDSAVGGLMIISDDQDHLPSLALASIKKSSHIQSIVLGIQNERTIDFISTFMIPFQIKTTLLS